MLGRQFQMKRTVFTKEQKDNACLQSHKKMGLSCKGMEDMEKSSRGPRLKL
jgi:hypothetical protein